MVPGNGEAYLLGDTLRGERGLSLVKLVPSELEVLKQQVTPDALAGSAQAVVIGGEALSADSTAFWRTASPDARFFNEYGPTEATVGCSVYEIPQENLPAGLVPIGRPIANTQIYILDRRGHPAPVGSVGELHIGGDGVAAGYYRRPDLTAERFIPDPFLPGESRRLYRTGDLARYRSDGVIELLGRADRQVKLRGYRIELGEVEATLQSLSSVREAAVVLHKREGGEPTLVAHVVPVLRDQSAEAESGFATQMREEWEYQYSAAIQEVGGEETSATADPSLRIFSWSGVQDVEADVARWVDHTVERLRELHPGRVLEIGCGTGSLLEKLAPHCASYYGTDISNAALENLRGRLEHRAQALPPITLERRDAEDFRGIAAGSFDTVILNSVVEYLPSVEYLLRVLEGAVRAVAPGGTVFLGDVPSLLLLESFQALSQLENAPARLPVEAWRQRVHRSLTHATRLVVDPDLFRVARQHLPRVSQVEIHLQRGDAASEASRLHADLYFDAVLHVECEETPARTRMSRNWEKDRLTPAEVRRLLLDEGLEVLIVAGVPSRRLLRAARALELLESSDPGPVGLLRDQLSGIPGVDIEELRAVASDLPYAVEATWSTSGRDGRCDIVYQRRSRERGKRVSPGFVREAPRMGPWSEYANDPAQSMALRMQVRALRKQLQERLPSHMVPAAISVLKALPRTPAGKVDYRALAATDPWTRDPGESLLPPRTEGEKILLGIVAEVLQRHDLGIQDNFFDLGADSLLIFRIATRATRAGISLSPRMLFQYPTVMKVSDALALTGAQGHAPVPPLAPIPRDGDLVLSFAQQRLWFLDQLEPGNPFYTTPQVLRLLGPLNLDALEKAFAAVLKRHETIRTRFESVDGNPLQVIEPPDGFQLAVVDLQDLREGDRCAEAERLMTEECARPFDLSEAPLMRASVLRLSEHEHILVVTMHHIVSDEWSMGVFIQELARLYEEFAGGRPAGLAELPIQYADFARWQREWLSGEVLERQVSYWKRQLAGSAGPGAPDGPTPPACAKLPRRAALGLALEEADAGTEGAVAP